MSIKSTIIIIYSSQFHICHQNRIFFCRHYCIFWKPAEEKHFGYSCTWNLSKCKTLSTANQIARNKHNVEELELYLWFKHRWFCIKVCAMRQHLCQSVISRQNMRVNIKNHRCVVVFLEKLQFCFALSGEIFMARAINQWVNPCQFWAI